MKKYFSPMLEITGTAGEILMASPASIYTDGGVHDTVYGDIFD